LTGSGFGTCFAGFFAEEVFTGRRTGLRGSKAGDSIFAGIDLGVKALSVGVHFVPVPVISLGKPLDIGVFGWLEIGLGV
jgi:hypothetical protein